MGKTILSIFLTEELEKVASKLPNTLLIYFFCNHQDPKRNTTATVLRGLIYQIISVWPDLITKHISKHAETKEQLQSMLSSFETLWIIFSKLIKDTTRGKIFCVLDGLDECDNSSVHSLTQRLPDLHIYPPGPTQMEALRVMVVSREIPGLDGCARVKLDDPAHRTKVAQDIQQAITKQVDRLSRIEGFDDKFRTAVQLKLQERAEGTFLWVGLAMHALLKQRTCSQVLDVLKTLPPGLPAIYNRMLRSFPEEQQELSSKILRWMTFARRPLQVSELAAALDVQGDGHLINQRQAMRDAIALCEPVVSMQRDKVIFVHLSAQEHLMQIEDANNTVPPCFQFNLEETHRDMAQKCIQCVKQSISKQKPRGDRHLVEDDKTPLLQYAVVFWAIHAKLCSGLATGLIAAFRSFFCDERESSREIWRKTRLEWVEKHRLVFSENAEHPEHPERHYSESDHPPPLHLACSLEIVPWIDAILNKPIPWYLESVWYLPWNDRPVDQLFDDDTALHCVARFGSLSMVQYLIKKGAKITAKSRGSRTVLGAAVGKSRYRDYDTAAVIRYLVSAGADIEARDDSGRTALHHAAAERKPAVVELLVELGANVNSKDREGNTPLHLAHYFEQDNKWRMDAIAAGAIIEVPIENIRHDREDTLPAVSRILLDAGGNVEAMNKHGMTVLDTAANPRNKTAIRLLVSRGADPESKKNKRLREISGILADKSQYGWEEEISRQFDDVKEWDWDAWQTWAQSID